jgi:hypothetical protein
MGYADAMNIKYNTILSMMIQKENKRNLSQSNKKTYE